jgi:hypothetical protein
MNESIEIGETTVHIYHYELHPMGSLQRHDRQTKACVMVTRSVTITQALRFQVDRWLMGAVHVEKNR